MTALSKTFLTIAIVGLTAGSIVASYGENASPALTVVLPLGAISFGVFLIVLTLEKEVATYDLERAKDGPAPRCDTAPAQNKNETSSQPMAVQSVKKTA